jgi:hypothetical protein
MVLIAGGCQQEEQLPAAICQGPTLNAEAVVTFHEAKNESYITLQNHQICTTASNIEISADEPQGNVTYRLNGEYFLLMSNSAATEWDMAYSKLILTAMRLGDYGGQFDTEASKKARIFGENYEKLIISASGALFEHYVPWAEITLYAHPQKNLIERITLKCHESSLELTSFAYNWRFVEELGQKMPTKIDVLNTENGYLNAEPVLQVNYLTLEVKQAMSIN